MLSNVLILYKLIFKAIIYSGVMLLVPYLLSWLIAKISKRNVNCINRLIENGSRKIGFLGIIIHELSHLIAAILFHQKILDAKLFTFSKKHINENGKRVNGYVDTLSISFYQKMGNYFLGIAPVIFSFLIIGLSFHFMIGHPLENNLLHSSISWSEYLDNLQSSLFNIFRLLLTNINFKTILFILLFITISIHGFNLSESDFKVTRKGIKNCFWFLLVIITLGYVLGFEMLLDNLILNIVLIMLSMGILIIFYLIIIRLIFQLCLILKNRKVSL
ncbi:hypothetical protein [Apilactobacillus timberlakei]|uniref:hypothetical protein n=1 Tax=Apilactobacillus timberlakei TaxID=2008380 RepID=UPI0011267C06|nr:hypothetical protein [Apilactobacillus timberlakei]TPR16747.1 hypothetical protein DYZ95_07135 [Apilactobacillus timberlakei]TPR21510.1 hypothetical protein DY083_05685 [Apilactobacillus timberlakei]